MTSVVLAADKPPCKGVVVQNNTLTTEQVNKLLANTALQSVGKLVCQLNACGSCPAVTVNGRTQ